jgi:hypothetical protein
MSNVSTETEDRAKKQARIQFEAIAEMVNRLNHAEGACGYDTGVCTEGAEGGDTGKEVAAYHDVDAAREAIEEDPLTVEVRSAWHRPSADEHDKQSAEYNILLCWGGPAVRIIGELDEHCEPDSAQLQYQDWFTPWEDYPLTLAEEKTLIDYARVFSFGE